MRRTVFTEDHEAFRQVLREFIQAEVVPYYQEWFDAGLVPREFYYKLAGLGLFGIEVPEEFGGAGIKSFKYSAVQSEGPLPAAAWRLRLHQRVPHRPPLRRQPGQPYLRRHVRGDEDDHR